MQESERRAMLPKRGDPVRMAIAFKNAVEAGREAYEAGLGGTTSTFEASASSPLTAFLDK